MNLATSPTRQSCRLYWQSVPLTQREEFLRRRKWFEFTSLNYLPLSRHCRGRHGLSNNKGDNDADDDADKDDDNEDNDEDNDDEDDNDDSIITQPPSPIAKRNAWDERDAQSNVDNNADDDDNIVERNACEECDTHSIIDKNADADNDATITWRSLPLSLYKEFLRRHA